MFLVIGSFFFFGVRKVLLLNTYQKSVLLRNPHSRTSRMTQKSNCSESRTRVSSCKGDRSSLSRLLFYTLSPHLNQTFDLKSNALNYAILGLMFIKLSTYRVFLKARLEH